MTKDIKIPNFEDLDKILYNKIVEEAEYVIIHQHDDEDVDEAIINGLDED